MQEIHGTVMHYPWGTRDAIPSILGVEPDGRPFAEYWLGAHTRSPSTIGDRRLDEVLRDDDHPLGHSEQDFGGRLPFLMKILSARHALSIQAHPSREQAEDGFGRENARGVAIDHAERTYQDDWPKPELLVALDEFHTLLGFRNPRRTVELFAEFGVLEELIPILGPLLYRDGAAATEEVFLDVLSLAGERLGIVNHVLAAAVRNADAEGAVGEFARTVIELDEHFPGDPGILAALLMNRVSLQPGEALYIPCRTMHAHLRGTGIEVMANSDNVIRGGLTTKHIAVDELVSVVDFGELVPRILHGLETAPGVFDYASECREFDVFRLELTPRRPVDLPAHGSVRIALVTRGDVQLDDGSTLLELEHGQAVFFPAHNAPVTVCGDGELFLSCPGAR